MVAEFAFLRATTIRDGLPGPQVWVVFRRTLGLLPELKAYFSNAPTICPRSEFIRVSGLRWPVEMALEEGQSVSVTQCVEHLALPAMPQPCGLPLTPQAHLEAASLAL